MMYVIEKVSKFNVTLNNNEAIIPDILITKFLMSSLKCTVSFQQTHNVIDSIHVWYIPWPLYANRNMVKHMGQMNFPYEDFYKSTCHKENNFISSRRQKLKLAT